MKNATIALALLLSAACSGERDASRAKTVTIVFSGPDTTAAKEALTVEDFEVAPATIEANHAARVSIDLEKAAPSRQLALDWYGPNGWLVTHQLVDAKDRAAYDVPVKLFNKPGTYRVVLRAGKRDLAKDTLVVKG